MYLLMAKKKRMRVQINFLILQTRLMGDDKLLSSFKLPIVFHKGLTLFVIFYNCHLISKKKEQREINH